MRGSDLNGTAIKKILRQNQVINFQKNNANRLPDKLRIFHEVLIKIGFAQVIKHRHDVKKLVENEQRGSTEIQLYKQTKKELAIIFTDYWSELVNKTIVVLRNADKKL